MFSIGMTYNLRPGCYAKYKQYHDELWPEVAKSMDDNEVSMAIFVYGEQMFLHAVAPSEAHWKRSREVPILKDWTALMGEVLVTDDDGNIEFTELESAFAFGMFNNG